MTTPDFSFVNYHPPGVYSNPVEPPLIGVYNTTPASVGIIGKTRGYQISTESTLIPPDAGGTTTTLSHPAIPTSSVVYTVADIADDTSIKIDTGDVAEQRTVTNFEAFDTASTAATNIGDSIIKVTDPIEIGSTVVIDTGGNQETRVVNNAYGLNSNLAISASSGATTIFVYRSFAAATSITIESAANREDRAISAVTGGQTTTLASGASVGASTISTTATIPVDAAIQIDTGGSQETHVVAQVSGSGPYTITLDSPVLSSHVSGASVTTLYALTVSPLTYAHVKGATVVAPTVPPFTLTVSAMAKSHNTGVVVHTPDGLHTDEPLTYGHFQGAAVIGAGSDPAPSLLLAQQGIDLNSLIVRDPVTGLIYIKNTDYTVQQVTGGSGVFAGDDSNLTITRVMDGGIPPNKVVQVTYHYTNADYFKAKQFFDYNDLTDAYGPALDAGGNIVCELSFAASFAFLNGATRIIAASCTSPGHERAIDYQHALDQLQNDPAVSVITSANGDQALHNMIKIHVINQSAKKAERRAIVGVDGSVVPVPSATRIAFATNIYSSRVAHVSPATAFWYNPILNTTQIIGGHYMAAALAGLAVAQNPALPLTRKNIEGFVGVAEKYSETQKDVETQGGLLVLERSNQGACRVRHGVTTNFLSLLTREWTILGQQDVMVQSLRNFLDNDHLIGQVINRLTLFNVRASAINCLEALSNSSIILGYRNVAVRQLQSNPDVVEVSFEWRPAMPLNYILLRFAIDLRTAGIDISGEFTGPEDRSISGPV